MPRSTVVSLVALMASLTACGSKQATGIVGAFTADATVASSVTSIRIVATRNGTEKFRQDYDDPSKTLPATLTFKSESDDDFDSPVLIRIEGRSNRSDVPIISRQARLGFVEEKVKLLRMPLRGDCLNVTCTKPGTTCERGTCVGDGVDANSLPDFTNTDDALDGAGGTAGSAGAGGTGNCAGNAPPVVSIASDLPSTVVAGVPFDLRALVTDDGADAPTVLWTVDKGGADPVNPALASTSASTSVCGPRVYTVTATDSCGAVGSATYSVTVGGDAIGYVSPGTCVSQSEFHCGTLVDPFCELSEGLGATWPATVRTPASLVQSTAVIGRSVALEGGFADDFSSVIGTTQLTLDLSQIQPGVSSAAGLTILGSSSATIKDISIKITGANTMPPTTTAGILVESPANVSLVGVSIDGSGTTATPDTTFGIHRSGSGVGTLDLTSCTITVNPASSFSTGIELEGDGDLVLNDTKIRPGSATTRVVGIDIVGAAATTMSGTSSIESQIDLAIPTGDLSLTSYGILAGSTARDLTVTNTTITGGGTNSAMIQKGIYTQATSDSTLTLSGVSIVGGHGADERVGVAAEGPAVQVNNSTISGSTSPGGGNLIGIYLGATSAPTHPTLITTSTITGGDSDAVVAPSQQIAAVIVNESGNILIDSNPLLRACNTACAFTSGRTISGIEVMFGDDVTISQNALVTAGACASDCAAGHTGIAVSTQSPSTVLIDGNSEIAGSRDLPSASSASRGYGVRICGGDVAIANNAFIHGGIVATDAATTGVAVGIAASELDGLTATANLSITNNAFIAGGYSTAGLSLRSAGIYLSGQIGDAATPSVIDANVIASCDLETSTLPIATECDGTTGSTYGLYFQGKGAIDVSNNVVVGGAELVSVGCYLEATQKTGPATSADIGFAYNLCHAIGATTSATAQGLSVSTSAPLTGSINVVDNIIGAGDRAAAGRVAYLYSANGGVTTTFVHNAFVADPILGNTTDPYGIAQSLPALTVYDDISTFESNFSPAPANDVLISYASATTIYSAGNFSAPRAADFSLSPIGCATLMSVGTMNPVSSTDFTGQTRVTFTPGPFDCP